MADPIRFNVYVTVKDDRLEDFERIAQEWSDRNFTKRAYVLSYEWLFMDEDKTKALVIEVFDSFDGILATMERAAKAEAAGALDYPYEMIKMEVCGNISDALRARIDSGKTRIENYRRFNGFVR